MKPKEITIVIYRRRFVRDDWRFDLNEEALEVFLAGAKAELQRFGIQLQCLKDEDITLDIRGYGDLLNAVRLRSPHDGIGNLCLGHIIGTSPDRNLLEDIRRGINRVAFAPETIAPEEHNKRVCHNCGCGC